MKQKKEPPARFLKQRYKDSNLEMTESESVALPFGDSAMSDDECYYNRLPIRMQALFLLSPTEF